MAAIEFIDVRKSYGALQVVHGINVAVTDGEFVVLVGPSGCGKSTLLRMVAGLEEISAGTIRIGNRVVNDLEPKDRDCAMVFQNYALYPHMSVYDNMAYGLKIRGLAKSDIDKRVNVAASILELGNFLQRKPDSFPADSGNVSRWAARSCASPRCSCSTSRCRIWTRSCVCKHGSRFKSCIGA